MKPSTIALIALGIGVVGVVVYMHSASAAPALGSKGGGGGGGDTVSRLSGGKLTTIQAQTMLKALGVASGTHSMASLSVDGNWGPDSIQATKDFQSIKGITADGIMGPNTASTLAQNYQDLQQQVSQ